MARYIYQGYAQDGSGNILTESTITVYEAGGTTAATIYSEITGDAESDNTVTSSATDGSFLFWVDDGDYSVGDRFKVVISKDRYRSSTLDYLDLITGSQD